MAAQADVGRSVAEPEYDAEVNINGTINVLEACSKAMLRKWFFPSTSAVYGDLQKDFISEEDSQLTLNPIFVYFMLFMDCLTPFSVMPTYMDLDKQPKEKRSNSCLFTQDERKTLIIHGDVEQTRTLYMWKMLCK